VKWKLEIEM